MPFTPIGNGKYKSPSGRTFTKKQVVAYYATNGFTKNKSAFKHKQRKVDNRMRSYGDFDEGTGVIRINKKLAKKDPLHKRQIKGRKGKYPEILDSIVHEEYHKAHPRATEKKTYKATKQIVKKLTHKAKKKLYARYN